MTNSGVDFGISLAANTAAPFTGGFLMWGVQFVLSHNIGGRLKKADLRILQGVEQLTQVEDSLTTEELLKAVKTLRLLREQLERLKNDSTVGWWEKRKTASDLAAKCTAFYRNAISTSTDCVERRWKARATAFSEDQQKERANAIAVFKEEAQKSTAQLAYFTSDVDTQAAVSSGSKSTRWSFRDSVTTLNDGLNANFPDSTTRTSDACKCITQMSNDPLDITATTTTTFSPFLAAPPQAYQAHARKS